MKKRKGSGNFLKALMAFVVLIMVSAVLGADYDIDNQYSGWNDGILANQGSYDEGYFDDSKNDAEDSKYSENVENNHQGTNTNVNKNNSVNQTADNLEVYVFDVGQADCILVRCDNDVMVIDGGNNADGKLVVKQLQSMGISTINYLIGTHAHEDHIGGTDEIIDNFDILNFYMPSKTHTSATYKSVIQSANNKNIEVVAPKVGDTFKLGSATCEIMAIDNENKELNLTSIVVEVTHGENKFLFMGDAEIENEETRLWNDVDVLKVGHHGSSTSTSEDFIEQTKPEVAILSVGKDNSYGHPHKEVKQLLEDYDISIYRTDTQGTICVVSDGTKYEITTLDIHLDGNS